MQVFDTTLLNMDKELYLEAICVRQSFAKFVVGRNLFVSRLLKSYDKFIMCRKIYIVTENQEWCGKVVYPFSFI